MGNVTNALIVRAMLRLVIKVLIVLDKEMRRTLSLPKVSVIVLEEINTINVMRLPFHGECCKVWCNLKKNIGSKYILNPFHPDKM